MIAVPFSPRFDNAPPCTPIAMYLEHPHAVPGLAVGPGQVWARCGRCCRAVATMELTWIDGRDGGKPTTEEVAAVLARFSSEGCELSGNA